MNTKPNTEVNDQSNPEYYASTGVDAWYAHKNGWMSKEGFAHYLAGNAIDYVWRHRKKGSPIQDLEKAINCLTKLVEFYKETHYGPETINTTTVATDGSNTTD